MKAIGKATLATLAIATAVVLPAASVQAAEAVPAWAIQSIASPTNFTPGGEPDSDHLDRYVVYITNSGGEAMNGKEEGHAIAVGKEQPITIADTLPAGLVLVGEPRLYSPRSVFSLPCTLGEASGHATVDCEVTNSVNPPGEPARLEPGNQLILDIKVKTPGNVHGSLVNQVEVEGGGAAAVSRKVRNEASNVDAPPGFQEFWTQLRGADGLPTNAADSHPYAFVTSFVVNMVASEPGSPAAFVVSGGDLRNIDVALPPGLAANPTVVERCTAQQFMHVSFRPPRGLLANECPVGSAVGLVSVEQLEGLQ